MNANDRFALELGRCLVRALIAEQQLSIAREEIESLLRRMETSDDPDVEEGKDEPRAA